MNRPIPPLPPENSPWSRRSFLARAAAGSAALGLAGVAAPLLAAVKASKAKHILIANAWHCIISLDCHSPIIALAAGTPAIHLRVPTDNPHKSRMFADIGLPEWIHELEGMTGARLTELVMDIRREPAIAAQKVARAMTFVRGRQAATMAAVRAALPA
jgi:polysaccharide pyruvyl transferase WcaK-like protein